MHSVLMVVIAFITGYGVAFYNINVHEQRTEPLVADVTVQAPAQESAPTSFGRDEILQLNRGGHAVAEVEVNGNRMDVLVDTGATTVAIRESDARRAGYRLSDADFTVSVRTANGIKYAAPIVLREIELGSIRVRDVHALVSRDDALSTNLLGMSFLGQLDSVRIEGGQLILEN
ncbi:MAG: TIGR02281 family clan AA aspartic protease [Devosiaceae bacterium]